jgi:hypothetical protein
MMKLFRDGYNKINLTIGATTTRASISLYAVDEPWEGPAVGGYLRVGLQWISFRIAWRGWR